MSDILLLFHVRVVGGGAKHFLFGGVCGVIAGKYGCVRIVQFNDFTCDTVKEVAVMGDDNHRAFVVEQIGFQPCNGLQVQMVSRLIQNNQVRLKEKEFPERDPGFLPAGQSGDGFVKFFFRKAKPL